MHRLGTALVVMSFIGAITHGLNDTMRRREEAARDDGARAAMLAAGCVSVRLLAHSYCFQPGTVRIFGGWEGTQPLVSLELVLPSWRARTADEERAHIPGPGSQGPDMIRLVVRDPRQQSAMSWDEMVASFSRRGLFVPEEQPGPHGLILLVDSRPRPESRAVAETRYVAERLGRRFEVRCADLSPRAQCGFVTMFSDASVRVLFDASRLDEWRELHDQALDYLQASLREGAAGAIPAKMPVGHWNYAAGKERA